MSKSYNTANIGEWADKLVCGEEILLSGVADEVRGEHGKSLDELFREVFKCSRSF